MKTGTALLLAGGGLALLYFGKLATAAATYQLVFKNVSIQSATNWVLTFTLQNVSNATLSLNSLAGTVSVNGNQLGNISMFPASPIIVPPNSQIDLPITLSIGLLGIPGIVAQVTQQAGNSFDFNVVGNMNINGLVAPFNDDVTFQI